jgi:hypothetical protein
MTEKYLLIYHVDRDADDTWIGTMDEYEKFSAELDEEFSEDGWTMVHFAKMDEQDEYMFRK